MADLFGSPKASPTHVWQDRELRFDASLFDLECRRGEVVVEVLDEVEDTKGNPGEQGELRVTNLRLIWISKKNRKTNIIIGFNCITNLTVKEAQSRLKGHTEAVQIMTKFHNQRFEFMFTALAADSRTVSETLQRVHKSYDSTHLYRDLKLRGAFIVEKELRLLPLEQTYSRVNGVWNLSSEQGNLGTFFISNVRVVWYANLAESFNVSMPYMQIKSIKVRENTKFGMALVLETTKESGGYVLGFKIDPKETLDYVYKEIMSLWQTYSQAPIFGVEATVGPKSGRALAQLASMKVSEEEEDVQIVDAGDRVDTLAAYYADAAKGMDREPQYHPELGLAVEQLKEGLTVEQLWSVL